MEMNYTCNLTDMLSGQSFDVPEKPEFTTYTTRFKVKPGVKRIDVSCFEDAGMKVTGVCYGLENTVSTSLSGDCGEYVTVFSSTDEFQPTFSRDDLVSRFLSNIDTLIDPLPECFRLLDNAEIAIDNPDFKAPKGILDNADSMPTFKGSTFKVAPRIFSEAAMKEMMVFPPRYDSSRRDNEIYAPFKECKNLERIENQGEFSDRLVYLGPCDFTLYDKDGFGDLSGYPTGGAPAQVNSYVNAKKVHLGTTFPVYDPKNLKVCIHHINIDEVVIDAQGTVNLPFGGIDFKGLDMDTLIIREPVFKVDLPLQQESDRNMIWTWGSLGISAPRSCRILHNLHMIWMNVSVEHGRTPVATPKSLKTRFLYDWGSNLEKTLKNTDLLPGLMPKTPTGLVEVKNYYTKRIVKNTEDMDPVATIIKYDLNSERINQDTTEKYFWYKQATVKGAWDENFFFPSDARTFSYDNEPYRCVTDLDEKPFAYMIEPLPDTVETVTYYGAMLYAHQELTVDVKVPAIPSSAKYLDGCYKKMFMCTTGVPKEIPSGKSQTRIVVIWSAESHTTPDIRMIVNPDRNYKGKFAEFLSEKKVVAKGGTAIVLHQDDGYDGSTADVPDDDKYLGGVGKAKNWGEFYDIVTKEYGTASAEDWRVRTSIVLEHSDLAPKINGGFQAGCFYNSYIDPEKVDCYVPCKQATESEWGNYMETVVLQTGVSYNTRGPVSYKGRITLPVGYDLEPVFSQGTKQVNFYVMTSFIDYSKSNLDGYYRYHLDKIPFNGSPRKASDDNCTLPYYRTMDDRFIRAPKKQNHGAIDYIKNFAKSHGISQDDDGGIHNSNFIGSGWTWSVDDNKPMDYKFVYPPMAWNIIEYSHGSWGNEVRGFWFYGTYRINDRVYAPLKNFPSRDVGNGAPWRESSGRAVFDILTHTKEPLKRDFKFQTPVIIDSAMLLSKVNAEYDISTHDKMMSVFKYLSDKALGYEDL